MDQKGWSPDFESDQIHRHVQYLRNTFQHVQTVPKEWTPLISEMMTYLDPASKTFNVDNSRHFLEIGKRYSSEPMYPLDKVPSNSRGLKAFTKEQLKEIIRSAKLVFGRAKEVSEVDLDGLAQTFSFNEKISKRISSLKFNSTASGLTVKQKCFIELVSFLHRVFPEYDFFPALKFKEETDAVTYWSMIVEACGKRDLPHLKTLTFSSSREGKTPEYQEDYEMLMDYSLPAALP